MSGGGRTYFGNLEPSVTKEQLEDVCSGYGKVTDIWVARNPPGFAFVTFEDERDAEDAVHGCNGQDIRGSRVRVEMAKNRGGGGAGPRGVRSTGDGAIYGRRSDDDNYKQSRYADDDRDRRRRHDYDDRRDRDRDRNRRGHYSDGSDQDCDRRSRLKSYRRDFDDDDDDLRRQEKKARHYEDEKSDDDESHKSKSIYNGGDGELTRIPRAAISPPALFAHPPSHPPLVMQPQPIPSIRTASHVLRPPMPKRLVVAAVVQMRVITSRRSRLRTSTGKTTPKIGSVRKSRTATTRLVK